ncbi:nitroreductase [Kosakonia oryzendophytica]|uniref:nitroreductase n=1 Tax=Kosakonia TaxID=1330547 RepID=UPI0007773D19|nr:nitroreductase [Kosakonia oryzendophytica]WBT60604.1 nitroreductase [Kosakonia oryzendophytica]
MNHTVLAFDETVRQRSSVRAFLPTPLSDAQIRAVLQDAQYSPSNCNTQPWHVHVVSGETKTRLGKLMTANDLAGVQTPDFSFSYEDFHGEYFDRAHEQARIYYEALGIARDDKIRRKEAYLRNYQFFNAPHAAFLFMPSFGDNIRVASDIGMYAQSFLLSLTARGFAGIPQTLLGFHADMIRKELGVSSDYRLLFGISFGYADTTAPSAQVRMPRIPVEQSVVMHG